MSKLPDIEQNVSRETIALLKDYQALIGKWNSSINLVAKGSLPDLWNRHILDSVQIYQFSTQAAKSWVDIGSGGGLPGLVIAILAREDRPSLHVTLVESDQRKSVFLRTVVRELGLNATVLASRVEELSMGEVDIISARALASLDALFELTIGITNVRTKFLFMKGRQYKEEITQAHTNWSFEVAPHPSITDPESRILEIEGLRRAN